jgi:hypothetical protein
MLKKWRVEEVQGSRSAGLKDSGSFENLRVDVVYAFGGSAAFLAESLWLSDRIF